MIALTYRINLIEPALLTALDGEPNSAVSQDFLPGSALRGAVIAALLRGDPKADLTRFFSSAVRFLNGYPAVSEDYEARRSLPLPNSLRQDKYAKDVRTAYDLAAGPLPAATDGSSPQWKNAGGGFALYEENGTARKIPVRRQVTIHTARDRQAGRATATEGAVFHYDALAAGQAFAGVVLCDTEKDADLVEPLLWEIQRVGGSTRGGYGAVRVIEVERTQEWSEHSFAPAAAGERQAVLLLSDTLVRDENGQLVVTAEALTASLGAAADADAFLVENIVGGFNRTWGLPLPQSVAVQHGSVLVLPPDTLGPDAIARLEREGVGERRAEGFGRVAIAALRNVWNIEAEENTPSRPEPVTLERGSRDGKLALLIARRIQAGRTETEVRTDVVNITNLRRNDLNSSQISRLREVIRRELQKKEPNPDCVTRFIDSLRQTARNQFEKARVGTDPLRNWLAKQVEGRRQLPDAPIIGALTFTATEEEERRTRLLYIDAVLARMAKQKEDR